MPIEGSTLYMLIRREADHAKSSSEAARAGLAKLDQSSRSLVENKSQALLELARHYLPEMNRPTIERTMKGVRDELMGLLAAKEDAETESRGRLRESERGLSAVEAALDDITKKLNEKVQERGALEAKVAEALKADPEFQKRSSLAAKAESALHRDEQRVSDLQAEAVRKLPKFEKSRLFRYLFDRRFGTPLYAHRGLTRSLDRWVARLIGYSNARVGYEFLKRTPQLVQEEVTRRRAAFDELMGHVEALQKQRADALGLTAVLDAGRALGVERDALVSRRQVAQGQIGSIERELTSLEGTQNRYYQEAIERFRDHLSKSSTAALAERAKLTPEPRDDALVAAVRESDEAIGSLESERQELSGRVGAIDHTRVELEQLVQRFRAKNFDSARSYFTDRFDPAEYLEALRAQRITPSAFWEAIEQNQRFRPHWVEGPTGVDGMGGVVDILNRPESRVLIEAIGDAVNTTLRDSAWRGVRRRAEGPGSGGFGIPKINWGGGSSGGGGSSPSRGGGFTSGEGF
jgi:hypothetical protein